MDILSPKTITISTYQGLLAALCGHKEENDVSSADIVANSDIEETDTLLSAASCTTNCLAPVLKVLNDKPNNRKKLLLALTAKKPKHSFKN